MLLSPFQPLILGQLLGYPLSGPADDALELSSASCDVESLTRHSRGSAHKPEEPLAVRGRVFMKKANDRQSPPKLLGGCAPRRGALVAMDATAAACGRDRGGLPRCAVILGAGSAGPSW